VFLHLVDTNEDLGDAWRQSFAGLPRVTVRMRIVR